MPHYRWNTAEVGVKHQSINQNDFVSNHTGSFNSNIMAQYRWNTVKVGGKQQSINQNDLVSNHTGSFNQ
jgi:phage-related protein